MKLITHNVMTSKTLKNVKNGYPLLLQADEVNIKSVEFDQDFMEKIVQRIDYDALMYAAKCVNHETDLPPTLPVERTTEFFEKLHHVLLEIEIVSGTLECPETHRKFPIQNGIPNMLLNDDET